MKGPLPGSGTTAARRTGRSATLAGGLVFATLIAPPATWAQEASSPTNLFGSRGLMGTPSARMAPDGELSVGASFLQDNQHYNLGFQILPWLEGTFRYSGLQNFYPTYPVYYDRAFGMKVRLWDEGSLMPAVAVGIDDIVGTGVYNGEYLVASKRVGDVDVSLGMGWGRRAGTNLLRNPLAVAISSFETRKSYFGQAGDAQTSAFFHGPKVGLFGGAVWHTPIDGLSLMVEYDSDTYAQEKSFGSFFARSQVNYGAAYEVSEQVQAGLYWLYGTSLGGSLSLRLDPTRPQYPAKIEPPPPSMTVRSRDQQQGALAALLQRRDPRNAQKAQLFDIRNSGRSAFVDSLWREGNDYADIQVRQGRLEMAVTGTVSSTRCAAIVRLMQGVATNIASVRLHDPAGQRSVACNVPRTVESVPVSAAFLDSASIEMPATPAIQVQMIDASAVVAKPNPAQIERAIRSALAAQSLSVDALSFGAGELVLYYRNYHYFAEIDAVDRITRVLSKEAPPEIEKFRLVAVQAGIPMQEFNVLRGPAERSSEEPEGRIFDHSIGITPPAMNQPVLAAAADDIYPRFSWGLYPQFRQALFDPNQPLGVQFVGVASAGLEIAPGLSIAGSLEANLYDDFDTTRTSDSQLPHVRSDFLKYFVEGKTGMGYLQANYRFRLSPTVYATLRGGYLESMFAGGGGEILWRPEGARWALGADVYQVWQRDFDRLFGLQRYHVTTGHVTLYYDSPWYGLNFGLRAGQYLAGDRGFTFQVTRRFSSGVEIGAFFTKTNVSAQRFGEGSFDKGIIIRIPLGWVAPIETQGQLTLDLRPVQRDGGQTLGPDATLYGETLSFSQGELQRTGGQFISR